MATSSKTEPAAARETLSPYLASVKKALKGLAEVRKEGAWSDLEKEPGEFSNAHKICDALQTFFTAYRLQPNHFARFPLPDAILKEDLNTILESVKRDGFVPGAYVYYTGVEFTDFAADLINLLLDFRSLPKSHSFPPKLLSDAASTLEQAIMFLEKCVYEDEAGCRWGATPHSRIQKTSFVHAYYTAQAASALARASNDPMLPQNRRDEIRRLVGGAGVWLKSRKQDEIYYSDEHYRASESVSILYCLDGIIRSWDLQREETKSFAVEALKDFVRYVRENRMEFDVEIFYPAVRSEKSKRPDFVDDRTTIGNVLATLCLARSAVESPAVINNTYLQLMSDLATELADAQDESGLWDQGAPYIYYTHRAVEALLSFEKFGKVVTSQVNEMELRDAVRDALASDQVLQAFMKEIRRVLSRRSRGE